MSRIRCAKCGEDKDVYALKIMDGKSICFMCATGVDQECEDEFVRIQEKFFIASDKYMRYYGLK